MNIQTYPEVSITKLSETPGLDWNRTPNDVRPVSAKKRGVDARPGTYISTLEVVAHHVFHSLVTKQLQLKLKSCFFHVFHYHIQMNRSNMVLHRLGHSIYSHPILHRTGTAPLGTAQAQASGDVSHISSNKGSLQPKYGVAVCVVASPPFGSLWPTSRACNN